MQNSDGLVLVRAVLIVGASFFFSKAETAAQVESATLSQNPSSSDDIQVVADQVPAAKPQPDQFLETLDRAIEITSKRTLTANSHSPWQIFRKRPIKSTS